MFARTNRWRGLAACGVAVLVTAMTAGQILETYRPAVDQVAGTVSQETVSDASADDENTWSFASNFTTAEEAFEGFKTFAQEQAQETYALLKNEGAALPIAADARITLFGVRSYAPVYGSSGGSISDGYATVEIAEAFEERGFTLNPGTLAAYEAAFEGQEWTTPRYGSGIIPEYESITSFEDPHELSLDELEQLNPEFRADYADYADAAIVVVGRVASESGDGFRPGDEGRADGVETTTGNILSLSEEERAIVEEAKANFDTVIVLVNSVHAMEIAELADDPEVDSILWVGYPGAYGFLSVADVLNGTVSPSAHLGNVFATNAALSPAMANYGDIPWVNAGDFAEEDSVNGYLIQAEGIYSGYRYYETRYADIVLGNGGAEAAAGTYATADGTPAESAGRWDYGNEVVYPFGHGLSYTTFEQTLDAVDVPGDRRTADVSVTVTNTGSVAGKSVVQLYASAPYSDYDRENGIEKSAIQLLDFEKTAVLEPGASQTIEMNVDLRNLASYDAAGAQTYVLSPGEYRFAIGADSHDALNNVLAAQGATTADGMTADGDADKTESWTLDALDTDTFSVSESGVEITNRLSEGDYSMDYNSFEPGAITYLTRSDWSGTFPQTYSGFTANSEVSRLLENDLIPLATDDDTSDLVFGDTTSELMLQDMKGAEFDDPRWAEIVDKVTVDEFLVFAQEAFHNVAAIPSVGLPQMAADDGPLGADNEFLPAGQFEGVPWADADEYESGTRVGAAPTNLAYSWNKELAFRNGEIVLGETSLTMNLGFLVAPAMNLQRHPFNSRNVEYYSEDPILSGYIGSAVVQGAQSKGTLVNIKHVAFNDQEINRSGVAVFMNEQRAREMELRNIQQAIEGNGKPASFAADAERDDTYTQKALGIMTSYNRIGAIASSANAAVMVDILRDEWGFRGYNVTDFSSVTPKAMPKESLLAGTTAFCGFGVEGIEYWTTEALQGDRDVLLAIKQNTHYLLYALANTNALNGVNSTTRTVDVMTWWRASYQGAIGLGALAALLGVAGYAIATARASRVATRSTKGTN